MNRENGSAWLERTRASYDLDAEGYAEQVRGLLEDRPALRAPLEVIAQLVAQDGGGPVADIGCGTGYVTRYLHDLGAEAFGIDLSPAMVSIARRDHPQLRFEVGTMTSLELEACSVAGIVAFWSTVHIPDDVMPDVIAEFHRVLRPGGHVLLGFPVGEGIEHRSTGYTGRSISIDSHRRPVSTFSAWLRDGGFRVAQETVLRPDDETPGALVIASR
ncbi:class I SAM-dependent methyltransferase [Brachybacterium sp. YJGR34]|uniref:class I SAM-dependent methyltransferase n=1 Tax=Brachybacterium sp. YJGR34 TaxID=2059911 RepID=UPI000E0A4E86|nr:class I SAM-dependent methyltransferase [Brachybacterium sp. YJGR34]